MALIHILGSLTVGCLSGIIYGLLLIKRTSPFGNSFIPSFFMAFLRIVSVALLWNYVLRRTSLDIILVLISFLASLWTVVIKKKVQHE